MTSVALGMPSMECSTVAVHLDSAVEVHHRDLEAVRSGETGSVHSWELVTAVDGPGTRLTVFLAGCPLRCQYCHNPDTWAKRNGTSTSLEDVVARIQRYSNVFASTGGGITLSGGEPLMQPAFVKRVFAACRNLGIHTALDTSGFLGRKVDDELLQLTDLVLLDLKSGRADTYRDVTGQDLAPTVEFGDRLAEHGVAVWVRFVLVPGLTDAVENVDAVADIVAAWPNVERVEVLPFHQMGEQKWEQLGLEYQLHGRGAPDAALLARVRTQFAQRGLTVF